MVSMPMVRDRRLRRFVFLGKSKARRKRRGGAQAQRMKRAPQHCKTSLGTCMKGGGRAKAGPCMRKFHACINGR